MDGRLIQHPPADGAWNMAVDEVLAASAGRAGQGGCLRFYQWLEPTISLGYFQKSGLRELPAGSRHLSLVRRPTGGGAIVHDRELTYSLALPLRQHLDAGLRGVYATMHETLVETLAEFGVSAHRYGQGLPAGKWSDEPFLCFCRRAEGDVLVGEAKVAGSAQRRCLGALLQHGSVLLARSPAAPELPGIQELSDVTLAAGELAERWSELAARRLGLQFRPEEMSAAETALAEERMRDKYLASAWTFRR